MDVPADLDPFDLLEDSEQLYRYHLFTNDPTPGVPLGIGDFTKPTGANYAGQDAYAFAEIVDDDLVTAGVEPVLFKSELFTDPTAVKGFFLVAVFDDGEVFMGWKKFGQAVTLGPNLPDLQCEGQLVAQKLPTGVPFVVS